MAVIAIQIANPTGTDVTVNAQVAKARRVTVLNIDNTTADLYGFLAAGCAATSNTGSTFEQREQSAFLLEHEQLDLA